MKKAPEGGHPLYTRVGGAPFPLGRAPCLVGHLEVPPMPIFWYKMYFALKNHKEAFGTKRRRLEAEPEQNQSRAPAEMFYEGEIEAIVITNDPLIARGSISINIFISTISSQTLVHLLYPIFFSKPQIGTYG